MVEDIKGNKGAGNDDEMYRNGEFEDNPQKRRAAEMMVGIAKKEYWSPFNDYPNVEVQAHYTEKMYKDEKLQLRGVPHKHGLEIERDKGFIRITEDKPIIGVTVLGSGCILPAYVVCEYPQPGITMREPNPCAEFKVARKAFNIQNLRRQHVGNLMCIHPSPIVRTFGADEITYELDYEARVSEASVHFEIEPTTTVTIRGGSGTSGHFSFRMIRTYFEMR